MNYLTMAITLMSLMLVVGCAGNKKSADMVGASIGYTCGMNMYAGAIVVE